MDNLAKTITSPCGDVIHESGLLAPTCHSHRHSSASGKVGDDTIEIDQEERREEGITVSVTEQVRHEFRGKLGPVLVSLFILALGVFGRSLSEIR